MEIHSFRVDIATKYGIAEAILLGYFYHWIKVHEKNETNFYDGKYWTFDTSRELAKKHPYLSSPTIHRVIHKLEDNGLILTGNYNKVSYDKTKWYTLTAKGESLFQNETALFQNETTIPIYKEEKNESLFQNETALFQNETTIPIQSTYSLNDDEDKRKKDERFPGNKYPKEVYEQAFSIYAKFLRPIPSMGIQESIMACVDDYGLDKFKEAVKKAANNNAISFSYIETVLNNQRKDGEKNGKKRVNSCEHVHRSVDETKGNNRKSKRQTSQQLGQYV